MTDTTTENPRAAPGSKLPDLTEQLESQYEKLIGEVSAAIEEVGKLPKVIGTEAEYDAALRAITTNRNLLQRVDNNRQSEKAPYLKSATDVDAFFNKKLRDQLQPLVDALKRDTSAYLAKVQAARRAEAERQAEEARAAADAAAAKAGEAEAGGQVRLADAAFEAGLTHEQEATKHEKRAEASATDLSRTRTASGTGSVRMVWKHKEVKRDELDLETLRPFFPDAALDDAIRAYIRAGRRELKGVTIFEEPVGTFR